MVLTLSEDKRVVSRLFAIDDESCRCETSLVQLLSFNYYNFDAPMIGYLLDHTDLLTKTENNERVCQIGMVTELDSIGVKEKLVVESKDPMPNQFKPIYIQSVNLNSQTRELENAEKKEEGGHHYIHILKTMQNQYFQIENVARVTALAGKNQKLTVSTSVKPEAEMVNTFGGTQLVERKFTCPSVSVFYRNAVYYHNVIVSAEATGPTQLSMRQIQSIVKGQLLSAEGVNVQFAEAGGIIYVVHPFSVEGQIVDLFKSLENIYTTDYITILLDYTEDGGQTRLRQIKNSIGKFQSLIIQSKQIYKNKRRYYQISFIGRVAAFRFVEDLGFIKSPNIHEL